MKTSAYLPLFYWIILGLAPVSLHAICIDELSSYSVQDSDFVAVDQDIACELVIDWQQTAIDKTMYLTDAFGRRIEGGSSQGSDARIMVEHIYPNVDLMMYRVRGNKVRYEFTVFPGGNPHHIILTCQPDRQASLAQADLLLAFQDQGGIDDRRIEATLDAHADALNLAVGQYDQAKPLTIFFEASLDVEGWQPQLLLSRL